MALSELAVIDVVFAFEQLGVTITPALRARIEWTLQEHSLTFTSAQLQRLLQEYLIHQRGHPLRQSLHDYLCKQNIDLAAYLQYHHQQSSTSTLITPRVLDNADVDSTLIMYAQRLDEEQQLEVLHRLKELGLTNFQCRLVLGLGKKTFSRWQRLAKNHQREALVRRGRSEDDPWSFAKHVISELALAHFTAQEGKAPLILETHQGIGDATQRYLSYGSVLGFEKNEQAFHAIKQRFHDYPERKNARQLYLHGTEEQSAFTLYLPEYPSTCETGLKIIQQQHLQFAVIDADPFVTCKPFFSDMLPALADKALLMVTVGDQHPWPKGEPRSWERFGVEGVQYILSKDEQRQWRHSHMFLKMVAGWYMEEAAKTLFCLIPIMLVKNFEPWLPNASFPQGIQGVDRIYFLAQRVTDRSQLYAILRSCLEPLPYFGSQTLREGGSFANASALNILSFSRDIWPNIQADWKALTLLNKTANDSIVEFDSQKERAEIRQRLFETIYQEWYTCFQQGYAFAAQWLARLTPKGLGE